MIRRLLIPVLGSGLLLAATAGSAFAKCEGANPPDFCKQVIVSLRTAGGGGLIQAGTLETVDISVSQGEQPFEAQSVALTFSGAADGITISAYATAAGVPGLWTAQVTLPNEGSWRVMAQVVDANGGTSLVPVETSWGDVLPVFAAPKAPVTTPPVTPTAPLWPIVLGLGFIAAAVLGGGAAWGRSRRRTVGATGSAAANAATADRA